jgi:hypothetical protein
MTGDIWKIEVLRTYELDWRTFEHSVVLFADKTSVFNSFFEYVMDVLITEVSAFGGDEKKSVLTALVQIIPT